MLILRGWIVDERSYAIRLAASLLGIALAEDTDRRAERFGPVLEDETGERAHVGFYDCLSGLATLPRRPWVWPDPSGREMLDWAVDSLERFSAVRRAVLCATRPCDGRTPEILHIYRSLEDRLHDRAMEDGLWLSGPECGFVDVAIFPVAGLARDLGIGMDLYPAIRRFDAGMRRQAGFITMPGIAACH
ncbi:glutathione S-transferase family protein [Swaminathania salitolerans]|uniref:Glutathione S-transferase n=1 Tax=Swaminathania salitolerans TaxID=182838 RepID=A0A511BN09_9PROT|nr:glutathione S-transferase family protein [Swaminathania salitolerans]GBQ13838.1 glutathione S-transferase [Swaminathania salitolerans LMG 21291]GEL01719.1 hypothetical protein SSA02_08820 [Swaminathania salitolerans]